MPKLKSNLRHRIKNFDMYGHPIELNFDEEGTNHKTLIGGIVSMLIQIGLLTYIVIVFVRMFTFAEDKNASA